jgi:hypothetical protein
VCEKLQPLLDLIKAHLRSGNVAQMDETTMTVQDESGRANSRKSYMWLVRGGPPGQPALWYEYCETREQRHIEEILGGFSGYLQSDGYQAYESAAEQDLVRVVHVGCWAHTRRRFFEATKLSSNPGLAAAALSQIKGLYTAEQELRKQVKEQELSNKQFVQNRKEQCKPTLEGLRAWLEAHAGSVPESGKLGAAVHYALKEWHTLERYLDDWQLTPDNNACERGIRPFVIGRKNWVMSGSPTGAKSSGELYILIETTLAHPSIILML